MTAAVLFDFSSTLFRLDEPATILRTVFGGPVDDALVHRLEQSWPGGPPTATVPDELAEEYRLRDLDPAAHRTVYTGLMRSCGLPDADAVYERVRHPDAWRPYPDTAAALHAVQAAGLSVVVVSNIAWDIRPVFERYGVLGDVDAMVLSVEQGVTKPDVEIFRRACERVGAAPTDVVMVGDNPGEDGAVRELGGRFVEVERVPPEQRPDGLLAALSAAGV